MPLLLLLLSCSILFHQALGKDSLEQQQHEFIEKINHIKRQAEPIASNMGSFATGLSEEQQQEVIEKINQIRRMVIPTASNMLKMKWSNDAAESAKLWAEQCQTEASPTDLRTVDGVLCGESRVQSTHAITWSEIIDMWFAKKSNFQYGVGAIDSEKDVLGYTQLIWYNTHEIGCAVAHCKEEDYPFFYVCRTCPAGNIEEMIARPYKEGLPCDDCPNDCDDNLCTNPCNFKNLRRDCNDLLGVFSCDQPWIKENCKATCECTNKII